MSAAECAAAAERLWGSSRSVEDAAKLVLAQKLLENPKGLVLSQAGQFIADELGDAWGNQRTRTAQVRPAWGRHGEQGGSGALCRAWTGTPRRLVTRAPGRSSNQSVAAAPHPSKPATVHQGLPTLKELIASDPCFKTTAEPVVKIRVRVVVAQADLMAAAGRIKRRGWGGWGVCGCGCVARVLHAITQPRSV